MFQHPWMAALLKYDTNNTEYLHCGASIISDNVLLTAAHCVQDKLDRDGLHIATGITSLKNEDNPERTDRNVANILIHPKYRHPLAYYDIALIFMNFPLQFGNFIHPICIPRVAQENPNHLKGGSATLVGFGANTKDDLVKLRVCVTP